MAKATGVAYGGTRAGVAELKAEEKGEGVARVAGGSRRAGGGRKSSKQKDPCLLPALLALVEPDARGDPQFPLRWTIKSTRVLTRELTKQPHPVSHTTVAGLLEKADFSLQPNRKTREGGTRPDRNAPFEHINHRVADFLERRQPAISVDTKITELVGQ